MRISFTAFVAFLCLVSLVGIGRADDTVYPKKCGDSGIAAGDGIAYFGDCDDAINEAVAERDDNKEKIDRVCEDNLGGKMDWSSTTYNPKEGFCKSSGLPFYIYTYITVSAGTCKCPAGRPTAVAVPVK